MNIWVFFVFGYLVVGVILTYIWWTDDYESEYELEREDDGVEDSMSVIFLLMLVFFWPFKVIKNYIENYFM